MFQDLVTRARGWFQLQKRLDPQSEQFLLNAGIVRPDGTRPPPSARTPEAALRCSAVYSPIKLLSETLASLPVRLIDKATKNEVTDHPITRVLREPNAEQTLPEFLEMFLANYFTWGVAFAEVSKRRGQLVELIPFATGYTEAQRNNGRLIYVYKSPIGKPIDLNADQVLAFQMFGLNNSLRTFAPIWIAQRAIELALAQEQMVTENFADGLRPDIIVNLPPEKVLERLNELGPEFLQQENLKIQNQIAGAKTRRELYLPFGYDSTPYAANYQQSQFQETRDFQILEFSRIWNVPPSKLGVISKQPNANAEQDDLRFYKDTLRPIINKLEKRMERDLLTSDERDQLQIRFNIRALLRGDIKTQTEQYTRLWQIGVYNRNEIRDSEDLPPIEGGDEYMIPTNMTTEQVGGADQSGTNDEARTTTTTTFAAKRSATKRDLPALTEAQQRSLKGRKAAAAGVKGAFAEAIAKVVRKEKAVVMGDVKRLLTKRSPQDLRERLEALYAPGGELTKFLNSSVAAPIRALFDAIVGELRKELDSEFPEADLEKMFREYQRIFVRDYTSFSMFQLLDLMEETESEADIEAAFEQRFAEWENGTSEDTPARSEKVSTQEVNKGNAVFSKGLYALSGITLLSVVNSSPCTFCDPLVGTYSINNAPIPPFHSGCGCDIVSGQ